MPPPRAAHFYNASVTVLLHHITTKSHHKTVNLNGDTLSTQNTNDVTTMAHSLMKDK